MGGRPSATLENVDRPRELVAPVLLLLLLERPGHGYDLAGRLASDGFRSWSGTGTGPVYRQLERLQEAGLVASTLDVTALSGPRRRIYHLTPTGADALRRAMHDMSSLREFLPKLFSRYLRAMHENNT